MRSKGEPTVDDNEQVQTGFERQPQHGRSDHNERAEIRAAEEYSVWITIVLTIYLRRLDYYLGDCDDANIPNSVTTSKSTNV